MITVRISFEKRMRPPTSPLLDLQRVMQRVLKRSGLPVWHTLGFNPHIYMTFACPLSLGQESESVSAWMSRLRLRTRTLPSGRPN